jgi:hypothetical protein
MLSAASPEQAAIYDRQLARARRLDRFPASTAALAVPDSNAALDLYDTLTPEFRRLPIRCGDR